MLAFPGKFSAPPRVPPGGWAALTLLVVAALNLVFLAEIWPHMPAAGPVWAALRWLAAVLLVPQLLRAGWVWLRGYEGPAGLRLGLTAGYLGGSCLALLVWLAMLLGGPIGWLGGWM